MPKLREILVRDIRREIEGVIKADDSRRIGQEIEEYVVTHEVAKALRGLFDGLAEAIDSRIRRSSTIYPYNGVWTSGYFGSGKSHLLKILAHLFAEPTASPMKRIFLQKIEDQILQGVVDKVFRVPATSVLFNIDQQADAETDDRSQVVLFVFEKVFNRTLGYCDDDPIIADFERDLDERQEFGAFAAHFEAVTGHRWKEKRDGVATADRDLFETAWASFKSVTEDEASAVLERYELHRTLTAELFAKRVKRYLDAQADPNHRINFFADEVGQFVANHPERMLNLQTIAETLATVCENRAWVFVTSQEDLDSVIGDANREQRNDFSRITARFYFRLPLTSANVEEVIQKRLLDKTEAGQKTLMAYYEREREPLRATFRFATGAKDIRYRDAEHFAASYPFLPYQFYYLQQALRGLSEHNAFMGRHVSRGERSMLEVFQDVGKQLSETELVRFAGFDQMFDGIRNTLKGGLISQINLAEQQISDTLSVRVLKILLMLKYVKDLPATADHLTILTAHTVDQDFPALRNAVQSALDLLLTQSYIQRIEDRYEYLTDQEQDIEREIKAITVDYGEIRRSIARVVFDRILGRAKLTYENNGQEYAFALFVDGEQYKQARSDLVMRVATHLNPNSDNLSALLSESMGKKELLIVLDVDSHTDYELRLFEQTRTYLNHTTGGQDQQRQRIIDDKRLQNNYRERSLREDVLPRLVEKARLYIDAREVTSAVRDPRQRLTEAFQELVSTAYPALRYLTEHYTESRLQTILFPPDGQVPFSGDAIALGEDESEMQGFLMRQQQAAKATTVALLKEVFSHGQYGWYEWAVLGVLAKLFARDAVELVEGSRVLDAKDVLSRLIKSHGHDLITVRIAQPVDSDLQHAVSRFFQDFFHRPATRSGGKELITELKEQLIALRQELENLHRTRDSYPFLAALSEPMQRYADLLKKEYYALATEIRAQSEELLMEKLETVDRITGFMNGPGRQQYDRIALYLSGNTENYLQLGLSAELEQLQAYLCTPKPWAGNATKSAQELYATTTEQITARIEAAKAQAAARIDTALQELSTLPDSTSARATLDGTLRAQVAQTRSVAALENITEIRVKQVIDQARTRAANIQGGGPRIQYATSAETKVTFAKSELSTAEDVSAYADALRARYQQLIAEGKRIPL